MKLCFSSCEDARAISAKEQTKEKTVSFQQEPERLLDQTDKKGAGFIPCDVTNPAVAAFSTDQWREDIALKVQGLSSFTLAGKVLCIWSWPRNRALEASSSFPEWLAGWLTERPFHYILSPKEKKERKKEKDTQTKERKKEIKSPPGGFIFFQRKKGRGEDSMQGLLKQLGWGSFFDSRVHRQEI